MRLKELREDNDLTQEKIAKLLNMKQQQYARYEKGINEISISCLIKLAEFYNTSVDYLLDLTDEIKPYKRKNKK